MIGAKDAHLIHFASTRGGTTANRQWAAHRGRLGFRVLGFAARRTGRGRNWRGSREFLYDLWNDSHCFLRKSPGPLYFIGSIVKGGEGRREEYALGRLIIPRGLLFYSRCFGPLLGTIVVLAQRRKKSRDVRP